MKKVTDFLKSLFTVKFYKKLFSTKFVHPVINERLAEAIDDKLNATRKEQEALKEKYNVIMRDNIHTFLSKQYSSAIEQQMAFDVINKDWKKLVREVNSTEKLINLNKRGFEQQIARRYKMEAERQHNEKLKAKLNEASV